ncbi:hypothetical protein TYRP_017195 [Tyrophagus putrescentiae]|nr:hypothetical protein TYRP_017195 [Tyrophagus putrescentiae]
MLFFAIALLFLPYFQLFGIGNFNAETAEIQAFSVYTNATKLFVGETFTMGCEFPAGYKYRNDEFRMYFDAFSKSIAKYTLPATSSENKEKILYLYGNSNNYISFIKPRNTANIKNFEIDITVKSTFSTQLLCEAYNGSYINSFNKIAVTVSEIPPPPPPPTLSSSVSTVHLNRTFILTCSLYSVAFYNSHEGELAKYDVDATGNFFFTHGEFEQVTVGVGAQTTFPTFELEVEEKVDAKKSYWCELVADWTPIKRTSSKWSYDDPILDFTTVSAGVDHRGRCSVSNFAHHHKTAYQIQFYSDLGPGTKNLLGYFLVTPGRRTEFIFEHLPAAQWTLIDHGAHIAYPVFEIVTKTAASVSSSNRWWCVLHIGPPTLSSELIKSNVKNL